MSGASFVLIGAQQERSPIENPAWNDAHRDAPAIFVRFKPHYIGGK
jgi:hypothetical protein